MKYSITGLFIILAFMCSAQVETYPDKGILIGDGNLSLGKDNGLRFFNNGQAYDIAVNDDGQLVFYPDGVNTEAFIFNDDINEMTINGEENNGTEAGLRITSGGETMIMDGNEIDAFTDGINLNFNSSQFVTLGGGGGGTSFRRGGAPEDGVDIHLKQSGSGNTAGGMAFEDSSDADRWKVYHSGIHLSFGEKRAADAGYDRQAYISSGTGAYVQDSDVRLKENILVLNSDVMDKIQKLKLKQYNYKAQSGVTRTTTGFIAQEVQALFPDMVYTSEEGTLGLAYSDFGVLAIKGLQEINQKITQENEALKETIADLVKRIEKLEAK